MKAIISDENRSSYVETDSGRILAAGLSQATARKFAAVNSLIRLAERVVSGQSTSPLTLRDEAQAALYRAGVTNESEPDVLGDTL
jgi:hypothetical protein